MAQPSLESANNASPHDYPPGKTLWAKKLHFIVEATGTIGVWLVAIVGGSIVFPILWFSQAITAYLFKVCLRRVRCVRLTCRLKSEPINHNSPVESRQYALLRNGLSLLAITAVLVRTVTLLNKAQAETFQTQSRVADCHAEWLKLQIRNIQIVVVRDPAPKCVSATVLKIRIWLSPVEASQIIFRKFQ